MTAHTPSGAVGGLVAALALLLAACRERPAEAPSEIVAVRAPSSAVLDDPEAGFWQSVPEARVPLLPQNVVAPTNLDPAVGEVKVRAAHDGMVLAIRVEWADSTESIVTAVDRFGDEVAIELPLRHEPDQLPSPMMGHQGGPVRILQWRSVLQWELAHGRPTIRDFYPNAVVDLYPDRLLAGEVAAPYGGARAVGNPVSQPRLLSPVITHVAEGFGTLTAAEDQPAGGKGVWRGGRWRVAITHPFTPADESGSGLRPGLLTNVAFAAWDGGNREVGSRKAWTNWIPLRIEE